MSTAPHRRPLGPGPDVPDRPVRDPWARTAAGLAAAGEWTATPDLDHPAPAPCTGRRPLGDGPADPGTAPATPG
ncbi:hypothetical protein [Streptomyces filamentosus]|uniref:hypothetical protein n=1 Tax=Streptomyces filamentosus TaxID=67294 RepID=UPI0033318717